MKIPDSPANDDEKVEVHGNFKIPTRSVSEGRLAFAKRPSLTLIEVAPK
jgi:hypothetical protein